MIRCTLASAHAISLPLVHSCFPHCECARLAAVGAMWIEVIKLGCKNLMVAAPTLLFDNKSAAPHLPPSIMHPPGPKLSINDLIQIIGSFVRR